MLMKKRIILYGVRQIELRRRIEFFLGNEWEIIGYSDSHYKRDILDESVFFSLEELRNQMFDYIVLLSFSPNTQKSMEDSLLQVGIPNDRIIRPVLFLRNGAEARQLDLVDDFLNNYHGEEGLIFGLSYSLRGINENELAIPFFNISWHGLDLYYNYRLFCFFNDRDLLESVKRVFLVFPYDFMNYDMSQSLYQYRTGQIFSTWRLDDWHNSQNVSESKDYIANYQMFGEKFSRFYHFFRYAQVYRMTYQGVDGSEELGHTWLVQHKETMAENKTVFYQFLDLLLEKNIKVDFVVPPFYLNGLCQSSKELFLANRRVFYQALNDICETKDEIRIWDYADLYLNKREYFADLTHLNSAGAHEFTQQINRDILND